MSFMKASCIIQLKTAIRIETLNITSTSLLNVVGWKRTTFYQPHHLLPAIKLMLLEFCCNTCCQKSKMIRPLHCKQIDSTHTYTYSVFQKIETLLIFYNSINNWSNNFDEKPHQRGRIFHRRHCNVTSTSWEHCSWLQQSRCHAVIED